MPVLAASPMLRYIHFSASECLEAFPVTEEKIYNYIKSLEGAAATYPRSFLISLSFSWHVLGLQGVSPVLSSGRIKGASDKHFAQRSKVRRRPALRASQVLPLDRLVHDPSQSDKDRIGAGFFLFLVYGRLRFSDAQNVTEMSLDEVAIRGSAEGFLECLASRTKTSISLERKIRALPIVVPMMCLGAAPWIPVWLDLRARGPCPWKHTRARPPAGPLKRPATRPKAYPRIPCKFSGQQLGDLFERCRSIPAPSLVQHVERGQGERIHA